MGRHAKSGRGCGSGVGLRDRDTDGMARPAAACHRARRLPGAEPTSGGPGTPVSYSVQLERDRLHRLRRQPCDPAVLGQPVSNQCQSGSAPATRHLQRHRHCNCSPELIERRSTTSPTARSSTRHDQYRRWCQAAGAIASSPFRVRDPNPHSDTETDTTPNTPPDPDGPAASHHRPPPTATPVPTADAEASETHTYAAAHPNARSSSVAVAVDRAVVHPRAERTALPASDAARHPVSSCRTAPELAAPGADPTAL